MRPALQPHAVGRSPKPVKTSDGAGFAVDDGPFFVPLNPNRFAASSSSAEVLTVGVTGANFMSVCGAYSWNRLNCMEIIARYALRFHDRLFSAVTSVTAADDDDEWDCLSW